MEALRATMAAKCCLVSRQLQQTSGVAKRLNCAIDNQRWSFSVAGDVSWATPPSSSKMITKLVLGVVATARRTLRVRRVHVQVVDPIHAGWARLPFGVLVPLVAPPAHQLPALWLMPALRQTIVCFAHVACVHGVRLQVDLMLRLCKTAELPHWQRTLDPEPWTIGGC